VTNFAGRVQWRTRAAGSMGKGGRGGQVAQAGPKAAWPRLKTGTGSAVACGLLEVWSRLVPLPSIATSEDSLKYLGPVWPHNSFMSCCKLFFLPNTYF